MEGKNPDITSEQYDYEYSLNDLNDNEFNEEEIERIYNIEKATANVWQVIRKYGTSSLPPLDPNAIGDRGWKIENDNPWFDVPSAVREIVAAGEEMKRVCGDDDGSGENAQVIQSSAGSNEECRDPIVPSDSFKNNDGMCDSRSNLSAQEQTQFEQVYMEWATNAFADELESLRKGQWEMKYGANVGKKRGEGSPADAGVMLDLDPNEHSFIVAKRNESLYDVQSIREEVDVNVLADMLRSGSNVFSEEEKKMLLRAKLRGAEMKDRRENAPTLHDLRRRDIGL